MNMLKLLFPKTRLGIPRGRVVIGPKAVHTDLREMLRKSRESYKKTVRRIEVK